jgi:hypothetical protein
LSNSAEIHTIEAYEAKGVKARQLKPTGGIPMTQTGIPPVEMPGSAG